MHPKMRYIYVGIDIHRQTHTAVIINCFGEKLGEVTFENKPSAFEELLKEVRKHKKKEKIPVFGLEDAGGSGRELALFLLDRKYIVKHVNSALSSTERKSQTILHKTDSFDALCVARVLLNKYDELPNADPKDAYWALSQLVKRRRALVKTIWTLKNQLHAYIIHNYPSYKKFFFTFNCKAALAFWEQYPSPSKLKDVSKEELGQFLKFHSHNNFSIKKAEEILMYVNSDGDTATEFQEIKDFIISTTVKQLRDNYKLIEEIEEQMQNMLPKFNYRLQTMKGIDVVMASEFIAEIGDINRFSSADKLAKYAGISPVTYSSGQTAKHFSNCNGNRTLNRLFLNLAVTQINNKVGKKPVNEVFLAYYLKKISEGKTKKQALKCVMRRLVNIIYGMMKNNTEYRQPILSNKIV